MDTRPAGAIHGAKISFRDADNSDYSLFSLLQKGADHMDRLFNYSLGNMMKRLHTVEREMREDSYLDMEGEAVEVISEDAFACIKILCGYMKRRFQMSECTMLALMQELYLGAVTGEYSHLQNF